MDKKKQVRRMVVLTDTIEWEWANAIDGQWLGGSNGARMKVYWDESQGVDLLS
jgi:hypothetical protein